MDLVTTAQLLGNFGEFFGAIAVVVTLIYLTVQIRQNTTMLRSQARRQVLEGMTADTERLLDNGVLDVVLKAARGEELAEKEKAIANNLALSFLGNLEIQYHELQDGSLDRAFEDMLRFRLFSFMQGPGRGRWEENRRFFTHDFQEYVDQQLDVGLMEAFSS